MKKEQFQELVGCLNGISSRLEAIEDAVSATETVADYASTPGHRCWRAAAHSNGDQRRVTDHDSRPR